MAKLNSPPCDSLDSAYNIARECVEIALAICGCARLAERGRLKAEKAVRDIVIILGRLRRLVEDAESISPETKAEFALDGEVVSLTGCSVHGAGACDAGIELARWLLARANSGAYNQELQDIFARHGISGEEKVPYAALYAVKSLSHRELNQLLKQIELKWSIALRNRRLAGTAAPSRPVDTADQSPKNYLTGWPEILEALDRKNNETGRGKVARANERYQGPIIVGGRGVQPKVEKKKLIDWWNDLETRWQDEQNQRRGITAAAESQHPYGRTGLVTPEIGGEVKKRRKDRHRGGA